MKKIITYAIITSLITTFSYVSPSFADTQIKNENIIKLDLKENNSFNLNYNNNFKLSNLDSNPQKTNDEMSLLWLGSILVPGLGQMLLGNTSKGLLFLGGVIFSILFAFYSNSHSFGFGINGMILGLLGGFLSTLIIYIWNISDAYYMSYNKNKPNKISIKDDNLFNIALFSKDF